MTEGGARNGGSPTIKPTIPRWYRHHGFPVDPFRFPNFRKLGENEVTTEFNEPVRVRSRRDDRNCTLNREWNEEYSLLPGFFRICIFRVNFDFYFIRRYFIEIHRARENTFFATLKKFYIMYNKIFRWKMSRIFSNFVEQQGLHGKV